MLFQLWGFCVVEQGADVLEKSRILINTFNTELGSAKLKDNLWKEIKVCAGKLLTEKSKSWSKIIINFKENMTKW